MSSTRTSDRANYGTQTQDYYYSNDVMEEERVGTQPHNSRNHSTIRSQELSQIYYNVVVATGPTLWRMDAQRDASTASRAQASLK